MIITKEIMSQEQTTPVVGVNPQENAVLWEPQSDVRGRQYYLSSDIEDMIRTSTRTGNGYFALSVYDGQLFKNEGFKRFEAFNLPFSNSEEFENLVSWLSAPTGVYLAFNYGTVPPCHRRDSAGKFYATTDGSLRTFTTERVVTLCQKDGQPMPFLAPFAARCKAQFESGIKSGTTVLTSDIDASKVVPADLKTRPKLGVNLTAISEAVTLEDFAGLTRAQIILKASKHDLEPLEGLAGLSKANQIKQLLKLLGV